jgi:hypothetical protein
MQGKFHPGGRDWWRCSECKGDDPQEFKITGYSTDKASKHLFNWIARLWRRWMFASLARHGDDFVVGGTIFGTGYGFTARRIFFFLLNIICTPIQVTVVGAS